MSLRSMGYELPVDGDPVKLHGLVGEDNAPFWRAECIACSYRSNPFDEAYKARAACKSHVTAGSHQRNVRKAYLNRERVA